MKFWTRKRGSQRVSAKRDVDFEPNFADCNGVPRLTLYDGEKYIFIEFESREEVRELQSQAGILQHVRVP